MAQKGKNNPEARLQASCAAERKIKLLSDHIRSQDLSMSIAKWEQSSLQKGGLADRERRAATVKTEETLSRNAVAQLRKEKLERLFYEDELRYEEELERVGMAYIKARN